MHQSLDSLVHNRVVTFPVVGRAMACIRPFWRSLITLTFLLIFFNEVLIYYINKSSWREINCKFGPIITWMALSSRCELSITGLTNLNEVHQCSFHIDNCTRILLIADPQLLGITYDTSFYSLLARYDSDRYLRKTFEHSLAFTQPHIICFLGDLLDEGNVASPHQFKSYVQRFHHIFQIPEKIRALHVPGDNDIGGENGEYISNSNIRRFEIEFMQEDLFEYQDHLRFFKINRMVLDFTNPDRDNNVRFLRIGISHAPILVAGGPLLRAITRDIDPHVIFSAHWHESRIFYYPYTKIENFYEKEVRHFNLLELKRSHTYLEIMVPTTSYRMGKTKIGLGYAVIEDYDLNYTVLWSPNRFVLLLSYVFWVIFTISAVVVFKMMTRCPFRVYKRHPIQYRKLSSIRQF